MHPKLIPFAFLAASCALLVPGLRAESASSAAPASSATSAPPAASAASTPGGPARGPGANKPRSERPVSYCVPTPPGSRTDWPDRLEWDLADLKVYRDANAKLGPPAPGENRVIFLGDSITENWQRSFAKLFPGKDNYIGRGRSSETTQQMLIRFRPDVIDLKPKVVVILAGTNDVAGNLGRSTDKMIQDNLISMIDLAEMNKIKVVLCSIMPTTRYSWQPSVTDGADRVVVLNKWIKEYAATRPGEVFFVDVHTPMVGEKNGMNPQLSGDGTHPNPTGYALISSLVDQKINEALGVK
jgi:lysophospholipase L1-like esterase